MTSVNSPKQCLVCLNSNKTVFVGTEESQKIFNVCCSYVKDAINIEFLINNIIGNNSSLSFCKNCVDISLNLSQLVEQLSKIKKEISDVSGKFSETITKQRIQARTNAIKKQFNNGDSKFHETNHHKANLVASDGLLLDGLPISDNEKDSAASTELINEEIAIDKIDSEVVKIERRGVFPDYEDESCPDNTSGYIEEEYETNYLVIEDEREIDPFGEIKQESSTEIVNSFNIVNEMKSQIGASLLGLDSSVTMPNIVLTRIPHDFTIKRSDTCIFTQTAHHDPCIAMHEANRNDVLVDQCSAFNSTTPSHRDKQGNNVQEISFGNRDRSINSTDQKSNLKRKSKIIKGRVYKFICSICQKSFYTSNKLKIHHRIHSGEKPYKCLVCEKKFIQSTDLKTHERIHTGEKPYKCLVCKKAFTQSGHLKTHERIHKRKDLQMFGM